MFDNIGSKIKKLAELLCWIGMLLSIIGGRYPYVCSR